MKTTKKRSATGSHATKDGYEEITHCYVCGEKIVISRQSLGFNTDLTVKPPVKTGWHTGCVRPPV